MDKHIFLATLHKDQNFMQWMFNPISKIFEKNDQFFDILDFHNNEELALKIEKDSFISYKFVQHFFKEDLTEVNANYYKKLVNEKPNYIHWMADAHFRVFLYPETVIKLSKKCNIHSVGYLGDCYANFSINKFWLPVFNFIRISDPEKLDKYKHIRNECYWQRIGVSENIFNTVKQHKQYDLIFIGRSYGNRVEILEYIVKNIQGVKLALYGSPKWKKSKILSKYYKGYLSNKDFYTEIRKSKISLSLLEGPDGITPHFNAKVFDSAFDDVMVISTPYDVLMSGYRLKENVDIVNYTTYDDLIAKINFYLINDNKREVIARNLNKKLGLFTMKNVLKEMFETIESKAKEVDCKENSEILYIVEMGEVVNLNKLDNCKYIYIRQDIEEDKYFKKLISCWDENNLLKSINIADLSAPGLILNYLLPISFRGVFYSKEFFVDNSKVLMSNRWLSKYILFNKYKDNSQLLRMVLFHAKRLSLIESLVFKCSNIARVIKGKYFA